uniref:Saposin B-type domain-containing protein n=1 Tax=Strongyloides papillosus TaxID=174720 RepID=A0A0N5CFQ4_STREA
MKIFTIVFYFAVLLGVTFSIQHMSNIFSESLCSPCKFLFQEVKKVMPTVNTDAEYQFKETVKKACDKNLHTIPLLDKVCTQVLDDLLEEVVKDVEILDEEINAEKICKKIRMC